MRLGRSLLACALLAGALAASAPAAAQLAVPGPLQKPGNPFCFKPTEKTYEVYGPTDIGATTGNGRLSVAVNPQGTLSVLKWPSPSYYDQLKYFTVDRDLPRLGLEPNEGAFSGLHVWLRGRRQETVWLRDLKSRQRFASEDSDTIVTRFRSHRLRLLLEIDDVVPQGADVLMRRHVLRLGKRSPVRRARLIAFANLNPTASKRPLIPTEDWCEEESGQDMARYVPTADAVVYDISELDQSIGAQRSVAVAFGASRPSDGHQIGADSYTGYPSAMAGPQSAYDDAADGELSGNGALGPTEVDAAISVPITPWRPVTVTFAAADSAANATALLDRYRRRDPVRQARAKRRTYLRWLRRAPMPRHAPRDVRQLAKRALISLRQAIDEHAGRDGDNVAIVASLATQSPYGEDWIRDGAFLNETLDTIGHPGLVERHNDFYLEVQHKLEEGAPPGSPLYACMLPTPDGNWFMTNYADGPDAGIFTWEIDETGLGVWTLYRHYGRVTDPDRRAALTPYLEHVYPAIRRAADFIIAFRDPVTGLQPPTACEDDYPPRPGQPTMQGEGTALLALRSAAAAARALGRTDDAQRYEASAAQVAQAIEAHYRTKEGGWVNDFANGGWILWPLQVKPYRNARMRAQAAQDWKDVAPSFQAPSGPRQKAYAEGKALLGLAHFYRAVEPAGLAHVKHGLRWIAGVEAWPGTGILGEAWYLRDGRVLSVPSQPHIEQQSQFYLTSVEAYGRGRYRAGRPDRLLRPQRRAKRGSHVG
jgi:hypothetical protein